MHEFYLIQTLKLAEKRRGFCAPNPAVGAVIVKNNQMIGQGYHEGTGHAHAEINALKEACKECADATLYISLEPCSHVGRTTACVEAIKRANIKTVYFAFYDPNPIVSGNGERILKEAGIDCFHFPLPEIDDFYQSYFYWTRTKQPWVKAKLAMSLNGKIATVDKSPVEITGPELKKFTHEQRLKSDAILTTINTVLFDDPQLNIRLENKNIDKNIFILDSQLRFPLNATLLKTAKHITIFHREGGDPKELEKKGLTCIPTPSDKNGLDLAFVLKKIGELGFHDLWVEAGSRCFTNLLTQNLANEAYLYIANKPLSPNALPAFTTNVNFIDHFQQVSWQSMGCDVVCHLNNPIELTANIHTDTVNAK